MATLHFFGGEKGGVGKSFVARTAIQYLLDQGVDFALFDADRSVADIKRIYGSCGCGEIIFSQKEADEDKVNPAYYSAQDKTTLVNLPPQVMFSFFAWFEDDAIFELAESEGVKLTHWFVYSGNPASVRLLDNYLSRFKGTINHILVKNLIDFDNWIELEQNEEIQQKISDYNVKVIDFPLLRNRNILNKIDYFSLTFAQARESKEFNSSELEQIKSFLESAYSQFDNAGVFQ